MKFYTSVRLLANTEKKRLAKEHGKTMGEMDVIHDKLTVYLEYLLGSTFLTDRNDRNTLNSIERVNERYQEVIDRDKKFSELETEYRKLSHIHHPDKGGSTEAMQNVNKWLTTAKATMLQTGSYEPFKMEIL